MAVKYSILMPYYDRLEQLRCTMASFEHHYRERDDLEVIIIEDRKNPDDLADYLREYQKRILSEGIQFQLCHISEVDFIPDPGTDYWTACHLYNLAALRARGDYLIITNPECFHKDDVLIGLDKEFTRNPDIYVVCSCQAVKNLKFLEPERFESLQYETEKIDGSVWLQHSKFHHHLLNYCNAMSARNYWLMNGFDLQFCAGYAFGDNDFRDRVILLDIDIINRDDLVTLHQWHQRFNMCVPNEEYRPWHDRNKQIYMKLKNGREHYSKILKNRRRSAAREKAVG
jgi:hypothetical protein